MADNFLALIDANQDKIRSLLPKYMTPERFFTLARLIEKDPNLRACSPQSLFNCVMQAAQCGLEIGTVDQHAFIIPYKGEATFQPSYRGLIFRLVQAGVVANMYADVVRKGDDVEMVSGTERKFVHRPKIFGERGDVIGAYSVATLPNGLVDFEIMELRDLEAIEKAALRISKGEASPAWKFFKSEMQKKSAIRRHAKRLQGERRGQIDKAEGDRLDYVFAASRRIEGDPEEPDDIPTAKEPAEKVTQIRKVTPEPAAKVEDRAITVAEQDEIVEQGVAVGMKMSGIVGFLKKWSGGNLSDLGELKLSQLADFAAAMQQSVAS